MLLTPLLSTKICLTHVEFPDSRASSLHHHHPETVDGHTKVVLPELVVDTSSQLILENDSCAFQSFCFGLGKISDSYRTSDDDISIGVLLETGFLGMAIWRALVSQSLNLINQ